MEAIEGEKRKIEKEMITKPKDPTTDEVFNRIYEALVDIIERENIDPDFHWELAFYHKDSKPSEVASDAEKLASRLIKGEKGDVEVINGKVRSVRDPSPQPRPAQKAGSLLKLSPGEVVMVAAHNYDLSAARGLGLKTAFVPRPAEYGPRQTKDLRPEGPWDFVADNMIELAELLGC